MSEDGRVAIAKIAFRDKEHLCALRFKDDVFVLETMFWPDEIRAADFPELEKAPKVRPQEVQMAKSLIENLTDEFKPEEFSDEYRKGLEKVIEAKVEGREIEHVPEPEETKVVDLMEALRASVEQTKKAAAGSGSSSSRKSSSRQKKAAAG